MSGAPSRVVVVGHDAPVWLAANVIGQALSPSGVSVSVVALPDRAGRSDVHATQPALEALHAQLRIREPALLRATGGAFSLGQKFVDASGRVPGFFHAYGSYGAAIDRNNFLPYWLKARQHGLGAGLEDFSLTAAAAQHGRMLVPDDEVQGFARADYGYHLPAIAYTRALRALAVQDGLAIREAGAAGAERRVDGGIAALMVDGERIEGDLFVDATADGMLIGGALEVSREDWRFPASRVIRARGPRMRAIPAYAQVMAAEWGWLGIYPAQAETHHVVVHGGEAADDARVLEAAGRLAGFAPVDAGAAPLSPGLCARAWEANCVAIGAAACAFDPSHDVALHGVQLGLVHLLSRFPVSDDYTAERTDYNRVTRALFERMRDFQAAHYQLARYAGAFWDAARAAATPPALDHKIATFAARGELALLEDESFAIDSWVALFIGHGLIPDTYAPTIDRTSPELMRQEFRRMLGFIKDKVLAQPTHDTYLAGLGRAA